MSTVSPIRFVRTRAISLRPARGQTSLAKRLGVKGAALLREQLRELRELLAPLEREGAAFVQAVRDRVDEPAADWRQHLAESERVTARAREGLFVRLADAIDVFRSAAGVARPAYHASHLKYERLNWAWSCDGSQVAEPPAAVALDRYWALLQRVSIRRLNPTYDASLGYPLTWKRSLADRPPAREDGSPLPLESFDPALWHELGVQGLWQCAHRHRHRHGSLEAELYLPVVNVESFASELEAECRPSAVYSEDVAAREHEPNPLLQMLIEILSSESPQSKLTGDQVIGALAERGCRIEQDGQAIRLPGPDGRLIVRKTVENSTSNVRKALRRSRS